LTIHLYDIIRSGITSIIIPNHVSFVEVLKMVNCPKCGKPLMKKTKSKYFCENENCPVIFVRRPYEPARTRVAFAALATEQTIEKIEEAATKKRSHIVFEQLE